MRVRRGSQEPTFAQIGAYAYSDGNQAAKLAETFWGEPIKWQKSFLDVLLARDKEDKFAFHTVGASIPRQNGKSWSVRARCFYGIITDAEKILYTCQHGDTADEMFKALSAPFEDEDEEELHALLKAVRKTNGQQAIILNNGGLIRFTTRTNSLARGKSYDVLIYDEAQELTSAQQSASLPTISASAKHNTQVIYLGTPPTPECVGDVFRGVHDKAHAGTSPDMAWMEWAASEIGTVADNDRWYETNPSLGYLIDEVAIRTELTSMPPDDFARERLGWWSKQAHANHAIDAQDWDECKTDNPPKDGIVSYAVKFSLDGKLGAIAVCCKPKDGTPHVELIPPHSCVRGVKWFADWIIERAPNMAQVTIDGRGKADTLERKLIDGGVTKRAIKKAATQDIVNACSMLENAVAEGGLTHFGQQLLDDSITRCVRRSIGKAGGWGFEGFDGSDPIPAEAAALAYWTAMTTKRNPNRKLRIG